MINYLNESHSDVVFGPCRRDISIAVEGLRMPYICTTFDPEVEVFKFQILPALSDFIEAMRKFVYGQYRQGGDGEYKTIIYEGNKGTQHSTTQWNVILTLKSQIGFTDLFKTILFFTLKRARLFIWLQHGKPIKQNLFKFEHKEKPLIVLIVNCCLNAHV